MSEERDTTPALGSPGSAKFGERTGAAVRFHQRDWQDARWSQLYGRDSAYANVEPQPHQVADANQRARTGPYDGDVQGPVLNAPVWTWEIPVYFWAGGMAAGASFVALACDVAGDERSAAVARKVALGAVLPCPVLLIMDLGRPARFLNMLRIFKPRSPMSTGAWCLVAFSGLATAAVGADLLGARRAASLTGALNAVVGGYLGSYTGVLLAATAVPVWSRSTYFLGPIFVCTGTATGAAACRLVLAARGMPERHPTRAALGRVETIAIASELGLSAANERALGPLAEGLQAGRPGRLFRAAKWAVRAGLVLQLPGGRRAAWRRHAASVLFMGGALLFRIAWVGAGKASARDHAAVARTARSRRDGA